jgi:hypothetical protein
MASTVTARTTLDRHDRFPYGGSMNDRGPARAGLAVVAILLALPSALAGCGEADSPPTAAQREQAKAAGYDVDLVYVADVKGYWPSAGGNGVYGDDGYQAIYGSSTGDILRLTVEHRSMDADSCAKLPVPGEDSAGATVTCTRDGDGWRRVSGALQEYAVARGDRLVRVSGTSFEKARTTATRARPATSQELKKLLPPMPEVVERGDITGDQAPDNNTGPGG